MAGGGTGLHEASGFLHSDQTQNILYLAVFWLALRTLTIPHRSPPKIQQTLSASHTARRGRIPAAARL